MPVLIGSSYIDIFVKGIVQPERKIILYNVKPVPILTITDILEKKNKAQDVTVIEEDVPRLVGVARQTKIPTWSQGTVSVTTDARGLVKIDTLVE